MAVPGQGAFDGTVIHASEYRSEAKWDGKTAIVVGCGNSGVLCSVGPISGCSLIMWPEGHDIAANLNKLGASVTLVQRSPTRVISRNASLAGSLYNQVRQLFCV
jgi:cation diffusion facilitator CzcD-associated flavoprotein CzcO